MSKLKKLIDGIAALIKQPSLINLVLDSSEFHRKIVENKYPEIAKGLPQIALSDLTSSNKIEVSPFAFLEGGSLPTDLGLLKILAQKNTPCTYFEIGTWRGESVANVASVAAQCYTLNLSAEAMKELGLKKEYIDLHGFFSKNLPNVEHLNGHSHTFDFSAYQRKIDMVFVDGDHHYESVLKDTKTAFSLLKSDSSIIVWHDYTAGPEIIRYEVFRGIWEGTPTEKRKHLYKVANTQCAVYYPYDVQSKLVEYPQKPEVNFEVEMNIISL
jgi:hypothetical protein